MSDNSADAPLLQGRARRTSKSKVGYAFIPVPEKRARGWYALKRTHGRALSTELWLLGRGQPIEVAGDWRIDLCRQLEIPGRERTNWCQAMDEAAAAGLLTYQDRRVTVHYETPTNQHPASTLSIPCKHPVDTLQAPSFDLSVENNSHHVSQIRSEEIRLRESETRECAHAREASPSPRERERPPLPPPPPDLPPPPPSKPIRVFQLWADAAGKSPLLMGSPSDHWGALEAVSAAAAEESGSSDGPEWERAVRRLLDAWLADKWVREHQPGLRNLSANLRRYTKRKAAKVHPLVPREETYWEKTKRWERELAAEQAQAGAAE